MNIIKKFINWFLIKVRIRKPVIINSMSCYQQASLGLLLNLVTHCSTTHIKFKDDLSILSKEEMDKLPTRFKDK